MSRAVFRVAIVHDVFFDEGGEARLADALGRAVDGGAKLAVLPELALDPWYPATREREEDEAEQPGGRRERAFREAARGAGIALLGGAIVTDDDGRRRSRALLVDGDGEVVASPDKLHLPSEEGFFESDHYEPGGGLDAPCDALGVSIGIQICSDLQRPAAVQALGAAGVELVLHPRATPPASYERWKTVIRATAITCACWVISVNRPRPERGVPLGCPSLAFDPRGNAVVESEDPLSFVDVEREAVRDARRDYPGYLAYPADVYARAWRRLAR